MIPLIKRIELSGFKSIEQTTVELGPMSVLIGANGAGKSNLISLFQLLREMMSIRLRDFVAKSGGANALLYYGAKRTPKWEAILDFDDGNTLVQYGARFAYAAGDSLVVERERIGTAAAEGNGFQATDVGRALSESALSEASGQFATYAGTVARHLQTVRVLHMTDTSVEARVRRPCDIDDNRWLAGDAGNLAAVLYRLQRMQPQRYRIVVETIRQYVPWFDDFVLAPLELDARKVQLDWRERGSDHVFRAYQLPDGALRAMALIAVLLQPQKYAPSVLVVDEPELGLHPAAITGIAGLFKAAALHYQVIVATQSVTFLEHFDPEDVVVVERENAGTIFRRPDTQMLADWLEDYSLGELWEKNVFGGGPF